MAQRWNGRTRHTVVTSFGYGAESYDSAVVKRDADALRRAGWRVIVVSSTTRAARDAKAAEFWRRCREDDGNKGKG